jgi:hypothetical protein
MKKHLQQFQQNEPKEQSHHHTVILPHHIDDKKTKKRNILEVISFKKSPNASSKENVKESKKSQVKHDSRALEPVEIAHIETLKVMYTVFFL